MVSFMRRRNEFQAWSLNIQESGLLWPREWDVCQDELADLQQLADEYRIHRGSVSRTAEPSCPEPVAACDQEITVREAAEMLHMSEGMVRRLCRQGVLDAAQGPGGAWVIDRESVELYGDRRAA